MSTLTAFEVDTYASKHDRRTITVMARDKAAAAAAAAAVAEHRSSAHLPSTATILTSRITEVPRVMTPADRRRNAGLRRWLHTDGDDAA